MKVRHRLKIALLFLVTLAFACSQTKEVNLQFSEHTPWGEETFLLPHFLEKVYSITDYGAQVKAGYNNQKNIQRTIDVCSKNGGGTVLIPEGTWQTSYLELKSNVNLQVSKGAVLSFLDSITLYSTPTFTRWGGIECMNYHPLIYLDFGQSKKGTSSF